MKLINPKAIELIFSLLQTSDNYFFDREHIFILGGFQLGQSASGDDLKHWLLTVKSPEQWIEMWHKLKPEEFNATSNQRDSQTSR
jgi:hypothetical protein